MDPGAASGRGAGPARVPVLTYHRVGVPHSAADRTYCIEARRFALHMRILADHGYAAVAMEAFVDWLDGKPVALPRNPFLLTFDDGFADLYHHAWPVLREHGWPATVFLVASLIGDEARWMRKPGVNYPPTPLLDPRQIREMAGGGIGFQSHSATHRDLVSCDSAALSAEIEGSRRQLLGLLDAPVECFAYPYGRHDERVVAAVAAAGYRAAFSMLSGFNRREVDRFRVRRLDVFGTDSPRRLLRKVRLGTSDGSVGAVGRYYWRRLVPRRRP